jgi:hypothetical protein
VTDVPEQLGHEALAEAHHLVVALALGVEVGAALGAAHGQTGERVLEGLLEGQELQDRLVDAGVEAQATFVGADRVVVLHPPAAVDADVVVVVLPRHPEADHPIGLRDAAQDLVVVVLLFVLDELEDVLGHLLDRLDELGLTRVALADALDELRQIDVVGHGHGHLRGPVPSA